MSDTMRPSFRMVAVAALVLPALLPSIPAAAQEPDAAQAAWEAGDHASAKRLYAERLAADSGDVQALHRLGLMLAWERDFAPAVTLLERLVRTAPSDAALLDFARILSWAGRFDDAEAMYRRAAAGEASGEALRGIAQVRSWSGDLREAERLWRRALDADPRDADAHAGLSQVLRWTGRPREALRHAGTAVRIRPADPGLLEQLAWAEAAYRPRVVPSFTAERDSDRSRLLTAGLTATVHPVRRLAIALHGGVRRAEGPTPGGDVELETRSASAEIRLEIGDGWTLHARPGVTIRPDEAGGALTTWRAGFASPAWRTLGVGVSAGRGAMDFTADLIRRGITTDDAGLTLAARFSPALRLESAATITRFNGIDTNERILLRGGLEARIARWFRLHPRATAFRFEKRVSEGYFAPDRYALAELGLGYERWFDRWSLAAEVAPGAQQIGSDGRVGGAWGGRIRLGYTLAPGRDLSIGFASSNLGIDRPLAAAADYRHQALTITGAWSF